MILIVEKAADMNPAGAKQAFFPLKLGHVLGPLARVFSLYKGYFIEVIFRRFPPYPVNISDAKNIEILTFKYVE